MREITRRASLSAVPALLSLSGCTIPGGDGSGPGGPSPSDGGPSAVRVEKEVDLEGRPVAMVGLPSEDVRLIATVSGRILVVDGGQVAPEPLLDLGDAIVDHGGETGLLGMALHPEYPSDTRLFVRYSAPRRPGTPETYSHTFVLASFDLDPSGPTAASGSERTILEIPEPSPAHNAGDLAFGPDGYLYVGVGDGGGYPLGLQADDWYDPVPFGNSQNVVDNLLGSLLRLDVDETPSGAPYGVPSDNPLVDTEGRDEIYAWGFRNPYRLTIDPEGSLMDGGPDIYVGDVGEKFYEEVNLAVKGGNYGWPVREGDRCLMALFRELAGGEPELPYEFPDDSPITESDFAFPRDCPTETPDDVVGGRRRLRDPVIQYPNTAFADEGDVRGVSVIAGPRYRGSALAGLRGEYVFADFQAGGRLFVASPRKEESSWPVRAVPIEAGDHEIATIFSISHDDTGELSLLTGAGVFRVVATIDGDDGA